jgi:hypothetical protein
MTENKEGFNEISNSPKGNVFSTLISQYKILSHLLIY